MMYDIIMPALGMTQDSGLILSWKKQLGDEVAVGDVLMEVETDKTTMEVEAQHKGFLTKVYAEEGAEVPVGEVIAIISDTAGDIEISQSSVKPIKEIKSPTTLKEPDLVQEATNLPKPVSSKEQTKYNKILASPKAKRLANEHGFDLGFLVQSGHPQPYHVSDLKHLESMATTNTSNIEVFVRAQLDGGAFRDFGEWIKSETDLPISVAMVAFAASAYQEALGVGNVVVRIDTLPNSSITYTIPQFAGLGDIVPLEMIVKPDLVVNDLTQTKFSSIRSGPALVPTFSIGNIGESIEVLLVSPEGSLDQLQLVNCMEGFINRLEEPLMHLL